MDLDGDKGTICCGCCCLWVVIGAFLIGFSFSSLDANQMGIDYNANTETIDMSTLYENGIHFLGVGHSFITFERTVIDLDMQNDPIFARTRDGLVVELSTRVLYRLTYTAEACSSLYLTFGKRWDEPFRVIARSTIEDVAARYDAFDFWSIRETISAEMGLALEPVFGDLYASLDTFTMSNFELPVDFQNAITDTDVASQNFINVDIQKQTAETVRNTAVQSADQDVIAILNAADAEAEAYLLGVDAIIQNMEWAAQAETLAYQAVKGTLNFTNDQLINFLWLDTVNYWARNTTQTYAMKTPTNLL